MKMGKVIKGIILIILVAGIAFIALYEFSVRDIMLAFETKEGIKEVTLTSYELKNSMNNQIHFDENHIEIKRIKIYRNIKSICLRTIEYTEFISFMDLEKSGSVQVVSDFLVLDAEEHVTITLNDIGKREMTKQVSTLWLERIMMAEVWGVVCALALLICHIFKEKKEENRSNHGPVAEMKRFFRDVCRYWQYMVFAAKADLNAEVANSYLNRLWWLLEPLFSMIVYVVVFGGLMGRAIENYAAFIFSSLLLWNYFSRTIVYSVKLIRNSRDIVTKVYVPKFVLLISNMFLNLFKLVFSWIILVPMLIIFKVPIGLNVIWIIPSYIITILVSFGVGMILLHYGVYIDDLSYAVGILLQMMMFLSGVFYDTMSTLIYPLNVMMICINPMAMLIDTMRNALLYNTATNLPILAIWLAISLLLSYLGIHIVYKYENDYVKVV